MVHVLLKPGLENFEHYFTTVWDECNCVVVSTFFGIAFLWDWNENQPVSLTDVVALEWQGLLALSCIQPCLKLPRLLYVLTVWLVVFLSAYRLYTVVPRLVKFVDILTNWYVRMNRRRLKVSAVFYWEEQKVQEVWELRKNENSQKQKGSFQMLSLFKAVFFLLRINCTAIFWMGGVLKFKSHLTCFQNTITDNISEGKSQAI